MACFRSLEYPCSHSVGINSTEATKEFKQTIKSRLPFITSHKSEACVGYTIRTASLCKVTLDTPSINNNSPFSFPWYNTSSYQQGVANIFYSRACVCTIHPYPHLSHHVISQQQPTILIHQKIITRKDPYIVLGLNVEDAYLLATRSLHLIYDMIL